MSYDPHPSSAVLAYASAQELLAWLENGRTTSLTLVEALLERITAIDVQGPSVHAVAATAENALTVARERDEQRSKGELLGSLHGLPVIIKDNIEAIGLPALAGSTSLRGRPTRDAVLVEKLRSAGAIILGSANLSQWANIRSPFSTSGYSTSGGLVSNPWSLDRSAGGSSSGSGAALAAGLTALAVGTETNGSIVCPASLNGVVGLKPTVGVTSREGVIPISHSQDSPGPMARCVADVALLYGAMVDESPRVAADVRLVEARAWRTAHGATDALFDEVMSTLRRGGMEIAEGVGALPSFVEYDDQITVLLSELSDDLNRYLSARPGEGVKSLSDVVAYEDEHAAIEQRYFGHEFLVQALQSGGCDTEVYRLARQRNYDWAVERALSSLLAEGDVVVSPAYGPAWKSDLVNGDNAKFVSASIMAAAIAGWPILSLPMGLVEGLPVGLTLVARPHSEWTLLEVAERIEQKILGNIDSRQPAWRSPAQG